MYFFFSFHSICCYIFFIIYCYKSLISSNVLLHFGVPNKGNMLMLHRQRCLRCQIPEFLMHKKNREEKLMVFYKMYILKKQKRCQILTAAVIFEPFP